MAKPPLRGWVVVIGIYRIYEIYADIYLFPFSICAGEVTIATIATETDTLVGVAIVRWGGICGNGRGDSIPPWGHPWDFWIGTAMSTGECGGGGMLRPSLTKLWLYDGWFTHPESRRGLIGMGLVRQEEASERQLRIDNYTATATHLLTPR
jgi:hypothetical protein